MTWVPVLIIVSVRVPESPGTYEALSGLVFNENPWAWAGCPIAAIATTASTAAIAVFRNLPFIAFVAPECWSKLSRYFGESSLVPKPLRKSLIRSKIGRASGLVV